MEKDKPQMDLTTLAATGTRLDLALAEVRGEVTVKVLKPRHARKGEGWHRTQGGGRALPINGDQPAGNHVATNAGWAFNGQGGIGKEMVYNLDRVKARAKRQYAEDRKAAARERVAGY